MAPTAKEAPKSFWSTVPGVLTGLAAVITATGGFATTVYPLIQAKFDGPDVVSIKDFAKRTVLEGGKYKIRDREAVLWLSVDDIKVGPRVVLLTLGLQGEKEGKALRLEPGAGLAAVVGSREYTLVVHELADVTFGADTAQITFAPK